MIWPSDDLLGEIQAALPALADLDCHYEADQERINQASAEKNTRQYLCVERETQYRQVRKPYVERLNELEHRMRASTHDG
jgi:hypothetical protein